MTPRVIAKVDKNQPEIVKGLRERGFMVIHIHTVGGGCPDLLVGGHSYWMSAPVWLPVELKSPGGKLTELEEKMFTNALELLLPILQAETLEEILAWFGWEYGPNEEKGTFEWQRP